MSLLPGLTTERLRAMGFAEGISYWTPCIIRTPEQQERFEFLLGGRVAYEADDEGYPIPETKP